MSTKIIKGTGIPASTLHRIFDGKVKGSPKTMARLRRFVRKANYNAARASGMNQVIARRVSTKPPLQVQKDISEYASYIKKISYLKGTDENYIRHGFTRSERPKNYWDQYIERLRYFTEKELHEGKHYLATKDPIVLSLYMHDQKKFKRRKKRILPANFSH